MLMESAKYFADDENEDGTGNFGQNGRKISAIRRPDAINNIIMTQNNLSNGKTIVNNNNNGDQPTNNGFSSISQLEIHLGFNTNNGNNNHGFHIFNYKEYPRNLFAAAVKNFSSTGILKDNDQNFGNLARQHVVGKVSKISSEPPNYFSTAVMVDHHHHNGYVSNGHIPPPSKSMSFSNHSSFDSTDEYLTMKIDEANSKLAPKVPAPKMDEQPIAVAGGGTPRKITPIFISDFLTTDEEEEDDDEDEASLGRKMRSPTVICRPVFEKLKAAAAAAVAHSEDQAAKVLLL